MKYKSKVSLILKKFNSILLAASMLGVLLQGITFENVYAATSYAQSYISELVNRNSTKSTSSTTQTYGYTKKTYNNYIWAYHILDKDKKTVSIRPGCALGDVKGTVNIPSYIYIGGEKYTVTRISDYAFIGCVCDECITEIAKEENKSTYNALKLAWSTCKYSREKHWSKTNIKSVNIPKTVTCISAYSFSKSKMTSISLPNSLISIGEYAFCESKLTSIDIPDSVTTIKEGAFAQCYALSSVTLSNSITKLSGNLFYGCSKLKTIEIPSSVKKIDNNAFGCCTKLSSITFDSEDGKISAVNDTGIINFPSCGGIAMLPVGNGYDEYSHFEGTALTKIYVTNYKAYKNLASRLKEQLDVLRDKPLFYCKNTSIYKVTESGKLELVDTVAMNSNGKLSISLTKYADSKEAYTLDGFDVYYQNDLNLTKNSSSNIKKITSNGYPILVISSVNYTPYSYSVAYPGYSVFSSCASINGTTVTEATTPYLNNNSQLYCIDASNEVTLAAYPTSSKYVPAGYYAMGYYFTRKSDGKKSRIYSEKQTINVEDIKLDGEDEIFGKTNKDVFTVNLVLIPIKYTVKYNVNGGSGSMTSQNCQYDTNFKITTQTPTKKGYDLVGWNTKKDGTGTTYTPGQSVKNLTTKKDGVVTLYAVWKESELDMIFDANEGSVDVSSMVVTYNKAIGSTLPIPVRTGYDFQGWTLSADGGTALDSSYIVPFTEDFTVYAQWTKHEYNITFNANGGTISGQETSGKTVKYGDKIGSLPTPEREGYTFEGWYTSTNGDTEIDADTVVDSDATYYAQWTERTKKISFTLYASGKGYEKVDQYYVVVKVNGETRIDKTFIPSNEAKITIAVNHLKKGDKLTVEYNYHANNEWKEKKSISKVIS